MDDLISRKALLDYLGKKFINVNYHPDLGDPAIGMEQELFNEFLADTLHEINEQPTAYDTDKVVEQLKSEKIDNAEMTIDLIRNMTLDAAIEIVKEGAVKE